MNTRDARALAAQYQSPGAIGHVFASFASGRAVSYERFVSDVEMTRMEIGFECYADMGTLEIWAANTDDSSVWR